VHEVDEHQPVNVGRELPQLFRRQILAGLLQDGAQEPVFIENAGQLVVDDPLHLVTPQYQQRGYARTLARGYLQHALPDPGQVAQVEHVVEISGRGQQFLFGLLPHEPRQRHQGGRQPHHRLVEPFHAKVTAAQRAEYLVHGHVRR